jgi:hypothetical protein
VLSTLLHWGTNIAHIEYQGHNLLYVAVAQGSNYEIVNMLLDAGIEVNPTDVPMSPLIAAVQRYDRGMVAMMLYAGAQPGFTALQQAVAHAGESSTLVLDLLLQAGACVNDMGSETGGNVIAFTGDSNSAALVVRLMDQGTDISLIPEDKEKVLSLVDAYLVKWHPRREAQLVKIQQSV